jgi:hypothetical protein
MTFTAFQQDLPLKIVEELIERAKHRFDADQRLKFSSPEGSKMNDLTKVQPGQAGDFRPDQIGLASW